jgi:hypothetical protein
MLSGRELSGAKPFGLDRCRGKFGPSDPRPLSINGSGQTASDLCCAAAKVYFFPTSACGRQQSGGKMSKVLARVLKQFLPVFSTAFECF